MQAHSCYRPARSFQRPIPVSELCDLDGSTEGRKRVTYAPASAFRLAASLPDNIFRDRPLSDLIVAPTAAESTPTSLVE